MAGWEGNVINPPDERSDIASFLPGNNQEKRTHGEKTSRDCGPGVTAEIPLNALVDANGSPWQNPPGGKINIAISTVDLSSPDQMPGDYTVSLADGSSGFMQSYGAATVDIWKGTTELFLAQGQQAKIIIPVDPSHLATGAPIPQKIPLLSYNDGTKPGIPGVWIQDGWAQFDPGRKAYIGIVSIFHQSMWIWSKPIHPASES